MKITIKGMMRNTIKSTVKGMVRNTVTGMAKISVIKGYSYGYGDNYI